EEAQGRVNLTQARLRLFAQVQAAQEGPVPTASRHAVIGWAGPVEFYAKTVGAVAIEGSEPGIYHGPLVG
ncbi:MAG: hypothetical protein AAB658_05015, partial [Chloroflexota bacterium]